MIEAAAAAEAPEAGSPAGDVRWTWERYASCWSAPAASRNAWLTDVVAADVRYRDPHAEVQGAAGLAEYMAGFAAAFPGHRFRIDGVTAHHHRSLAAWTQVDSSGHAVSRGQSFALDDHGRLTDITGFFLGAE